MTDPFTEEGLAGFDATVAATVEHGEVPGIVALAGRGDQAHVATAGVLTLDGPAVGRSSLYRIASTTKPMVGAAAVALLHEGLIDLEEPVDRLLPELADRRVLRRLDGPLDDTVPACRPITVEDVLTFRMGFGMGLELFTAASPPPIARAEADAALGTLGPPDPSKQPDPDAWLARLGSLPLMAQPGERWLYNTGASVAGILLARAAGTSLGEVLRSRIFEPLGMVDTAFVAPATDRLATAYRQTDDGLEAWDPPDGIWSRPQPFEDGAAGLVSSVDDILTFSQMLLADGDPILPAAGVARMASDHLTPEQRTGGSAFLDGRGWGFCQSVVVDGPQAGAFGWDGGFGCSWIADPNVDLSVVVLTQRMWAGPTDTALHRRIEAAAYAALS